jgi:hypothetical protein
MNHTNFPSKLNSVLNWQFSIDPCMNVQYTGGPTRQFSTYSSEEFSIHVLWKNYRLQWELWLVKILKLEDYSPITFKLVKCLYIHTFHWTCPINLCLQCADDWWIHKLILMGPLSFPQMCKSLRSFQFVYHRAFPQCAVHWWVHNTICHRSLPQWAAHWWILNSCSMVWFWIPNTGSTGEYLHPARLVTHHLKNLGINSIHSCIPQWVFKTCWKTSEILGMTILMYLPWTWLWDIPW